VTIEWDTLKNGSHALDYITTYNRTETDADPCSGVDDCVGPPHQLRIPLDPNLNGAGKFPGVDGTIGTADDLTLTLTSGLMSLFGGTITGISTPTTSPGSDVPTKITISFTTTVTNPVLAWGGHIATRLDWGADNSAIAIPGSPYHTRFVDLDGKGAIRTAH
jgi:hypothetical protein